MPKNFQTTANLRLQQYPRLSWCLLVSESPELRGACRKLVEEADEGSRQR